MSLLNNSFIQHVQANNVLDLTIYLFQVHNAQCWCSEKWFVSTLSDKYKMTSEKGIIMSYYTFFY